ncbi:DUF4347 domain-containing protein, partial [Dolichospermum sp. ST_con]|nr:DUF4347 domain-containing protein [Dolichospermum sp. ST_con]
MWEETGKTIAFVDANVFDAKTILSGLEADIKVLLNPGRDGIAQITETLAHYQNLSSIDIISHGNVAQIQLGNRVLSAN